MNAQQLDSIGKDVEVGTYKIAITRLGNRGCGPRRSRRAGQLSDHIPGDTADLKIAECINPIRRAAGEYSSTSGRCVTAHYGVPMGKTCERLRTGVPQHL